MPTNASYVGGLALPVNPGELNSELVDPTVRGMLDYLAFWLNYTLSPKLSNIQGTSAVAVPANNRYPFDPDTVFVREAVPALYVWGTTSKYDEWTLVWGMRTRTINVMYVFDPLHTPKGVTVRHGLENAVDATFARACDWGRHREYGYNGDPPNTPIAKSVGWKRWDYQQFASGLIWKIPTGAGGGAGGGSFGNTNDGSDRRGYPSVRGTFAVQQLIGGDQLLDPQDVATDIAVTIETGDNTADTVTIREGILPAPDGAPNGIDDR
tara:strand:- start:554 stop:1351 length:798 start_codon:yes stop_codon:yes gene_type:complete